MNKETFDRISCDWGNLAVFILASYIQFFSGLVFCWFLHTYVREKMFLEYNNLSLTGRGDIGFLCCVSSFCTLSQFWSFPISLPWTFLSFSAFLLLCYYIMIMLLYYDLAINICDNKSNSDCRYFSNLQ